METLVGLLIGVVIGATGIGGGILTTPVLILGLGVTPRLAVAIALVYSAAVKIWASGVYLWRRQVDFRILSCLLGGGLPGVILGSMAMQHGRGAKSEGWILAVIGVLVSASAASSLLRRAGATPIEGPRFRLVAFVSLPIGLETGYSSAGTGVLGSIVLFRLTQLPPADVVGTNLWFGMVLSAAGGGVHALTGNCDWTMLAKLIPAGIVGSIAGAGLAQRMPSEALRTAVLQCAGLVGMVLLGKGIERII